MHNTEIDDSNLDQYYEKEKPKTTLVSRNITVMKRRTSVRLEPEMWQALREIAKRERCTIHNICTLIDMRKNEKTSLTAAIRVFLMLYFRAATTEEGHRKAGHGDFEVMKRRARIDESATSVFSKKTPRNFTRSTPHYAHETLHDGMSPDVSEGLKGGKEYSIESQISAAH